ncbi:MAG: phosphoheptose isomerase [Deltaproteobacteria bacterium]|nr:MAG: phosphoheptose isomerase [Deltaproteobacteria bacterium]
MKDIIEKALEDSLRVKEAFIRSNVHAITDVAEKIAGAFISDRKLLICGNGGSAADAQHLASEFVNRYLLERPPLPAIALTTDTSTITSIANDYTFDDIFSKQVKALGLEGDILLAISTSGESENVLRAVGAAKAQGLYTVALTGKDGGKLAPLADTSLVVGSDVTARIQEAHILVGHILCRLVDYILFQRHA